MLRDPRAYLWDVRDAGSAIQQFIAFRNQLIHGYAVVKQQTVWNVVQDSLPPLLEQVKALLQETGEV